MSAHNRRLKVVVFKLATVEYQCQLNEWKLTPKADAGDKQYSFCPDGEFREETDEDWELELKFFADWRPNGISRFLITARGQTVPFILDHLPGITDEHVRWTGQAKILPPSIGGQVRKTEMTEVKLPVIGEPVFDEDPVAV